MKKSFKIIAIGVVVLIVGAVVAYFTLYKDYPYYKTMQAVRVTSFTKDKISVSANVVCFNPNKVGCRLAGCDFEVFANGVKVSDVKQTLSANVGADAEFLIPLKVSFSPKKIFKPMDLIGAALSGLQSRSIELRYLGTVDVGLAGQDISIGVDYSESIPLKVE